jgi:hypothetical protein
MDGGYYDSWSFDERVWDGGEALALTATGDEVGAFSTTLVAPAVSIPIAPTCVGGSCGTASRASDLAVSWSGGAHSAQLVIMVSRRASDVRYIQCQITTSPAVVPAAVMGLIKPVDAGYATEMTLVSANSVEILTGDTVVVFTAGHFGPHGISSGSLLTVD